MRRNALRLALRIAVLVAMAVPCRAHAAVSVYTSLASFQAAVPPVTLVATFETKALGPTGTFVEGGLTFSSPLGNMYVIGPGNPGSTNPLPPTRMLSANGQEDLSVAINAGPTYAIGFTLLSNRFAPHSVSLFDASNTVFFTHAPTQALNTIGFLGFVSTTPISKLRWVAASGQTQNTALDEFHLLPVGVTSASATSWGRVKSLYR